MKDGTVSRADQLHFRAPYIMAYFFSDYGLGASWIELFSVHVPKEKFTYFL